jgi:hypothetical protein
MAERPIRYRMHNVAAVLSEEEYRDLRQVCIDLAVPVRVILMIGVRRARSVLRVERQHQPRSDA